MTGSGHRRQRLAALVLAIGWLLLAVACAQLPTDDTSQLWQPGWQGRLAIKVATDPPQAFSASFALQGTAQAGTLALTSVLGTRLATLRWSAEAASLQTPQELIQFASADAMVAHSTGTPLPLAALFGWLQGDPSTPNGWAVDLHDLASGRIRAWRLAPDTEAEIKIILEPR